MQPWSVKTSNSCSLVSHVVSISIVSFVFCRSQLTLLLTSLIRDFPDHATFRDKGAKLDCADKLGVFLSLTLCIKANFDPLQRIKYDGLEKM